MFLYDIYLNNNICVLVYAHSVKEYYGKVFFISNGDPVAVFDRMDVFYWHRTLKKD